MASSELNSLTDTLPPSPLKEDADKPKVVMKEETSTEDTLLRNEDALLGIADLSNSSVVITPKSTPDKDDTKKTQDVKAVTSKEEVTTEDPVCKTALVDKLNKVVEVDKQKRPKSGRRGRRKKKQTEPTTSEDTKSTSSSTAKPKAPRKKKTEGDGMKNTFLTDYFPVRRSDRKSKSIIDKEKEDDLYNKIISGCEDGLKVEDIDNKGRGVLASKNFQRGDFVVEYAGDLISIPEAKERDDNYSKDPTKGCYMYYFQFKNKSYCIDATLESGKLGRLLNHSKTNNNCHTKLVDVKGNPYLIIVASRDISEGEELLYDYGDRSKSALESHPWLKS